jgi:hypothetical protein
LPAGGHVGDQGGLPGVESFSADSGFGQREFDVAPLGATAAATVGGGDDAPFGGQGFRGGVELGAVAGVDRGAVAAAQQGGFVAFPVVDAGVGSE